MKHLPVFLALGLGLSAIAMQATAATATQPALPGQSLYHLQTGFTDQGGHALQWHDLRGRPQLVSMLYTNCHLMCPLIVENAKGVQKQLTAAQREKLGVVMISLDPARDTPAALADMAERHRTGDGWRFLQPNANDVPALANVLDVRYRFREDGSINHTSTLVLLDADGRILARGEVESAVPDPAFIDKVRHALAGD
ncbi:MAG: SCO family protein [Stenotrophomonas sp.]